MKIDPSSLSPVGNIQAINRLKQVKRNASVSGTDNMAVSDKAQVFQTLLQKTKDIPSIREDRVQALSRQIDRGEFQINAQKIAERLSSLEKI